MTKAGSAKRSAADLDAGGLALLDEAGTPIQVVPYEVCEGVRHMMARLRLTDGADVPARLGLVSALSGEGVSVLAIALGLVLSNDLGRRVCVVDLNWWSPSPLFGSQSSGGVAAIVAGAAGTEAVLVGTGNPGLTLLPAGATMPSERPLLANSAELGEILRDLQQRFDHVIVDLPALDMTSDALTLAERAGDLMLVVHHGVTPEADVIGAVDKLAGLSVLGAILNVHSSKLPGFVRRRVLAV